MEGRRRMIRLELHCAGRILRVTLSPRWRWGAVRCSGVLLIDAGPLSVSAYTRRMYWERL
jgi:hypothetical protein